VDTSCPVFPVTSAAVRADRLLAIVLLLQARRRASAPELAAELEVSERTIRRDMEALSSAGIPVYPVRGRLGGWSLVEGYRTELTGLSPAEMRALFLLVSASSMPGLGVDDAARSLSRKLVAALPGGADEALGLARLVHVEPAPWNREAETPPLLGALRDAVLEGRRVVIEYAKPGSDASRRSVDPYGLVAQAGVWYLVGGTDGGRRTFRVSRVLAVETTGEAAVRLPAFSLAAEWARSREELRERWTASCVIRVAVEPSAVRPVLGMFGGRGTLLGVERAADGSAACVLGFGNAAVAAFELAGFGARVRVLDAPEVRAALARIGAELVAVAAGGPEPAGRVPPARRTARR